MRKIVFILFLVGCCCWPKNILAYTKSEVLAQMNSARVENKQKELKENYLLEEAANNKLKDIQKYSYWSHNNTVTNKNWLTFVREVGFDGMAGENLARGFTLVDPMVKAWLNSPDHRKNLLSSKFNMVGISVGEVDYGNRVDTVVVVIFGKKGLFSTAIKNFTNSIADST